MFVPRTELFLCDIREQRHTLIMNQIWNQLLAGFQSSSITTLLQGSQVELTMWHMLSEQVGQGSIYEYIKVKYMPIKNVMNFRKGKAYNWNMRTITQWYSTIKCYEHTNPKLENMFFSSLTYLRNGFVLGTNIWIWIFKWTRNIIWAVKQIL